MSIFSQRLVLYFVAGVVAAFSAAVLIDRSSVAAAQVAGGDGLIDSATVEPSGVGGEAGGEEFDSLVAQERQSVFEGLLQQLDSMVPGEFEEGSPQKAELERAVKAFLDRDIVTLNEILDEQAAFDPDFPPRHLLLASMSFHIKSPAQGRELLEKAAVKSPNYPGTFAAFARLALVEGRIADSMAQLEKCARAVSENKVSDKARKHFERQYVAGMMQIALARDQYPAAREFFEQHRKLNPDNPRSYLTGAEIEFKSGNVRQAQSYLEELKELVPEARPFESVFARWYREQGDKEAVGTWVAAAAEKYPNDISSQVDYANWLMRSGDFSGAQATLAKAESLLGETSVTQLMKGQLAFANDNIEEAERLFEKIVASTKGENLEAANLYSLALAESGDPEKLKKAQAITQQTLGRAPRNTVIQATLGYILLRQGNTDQAQRLILPAVRGKRVSSEVAYFFGYMLNTLGKKDTAREALQSALENEGGFLYRKKCQTLLDELGGSILPRKVSDPEPAEPLPLPEP